MDMKKIIMVNTIFSLILIVVGIKVYIDFNDDKNDFNKFLDIKTEEDVNSLREICNIKKYFEPMCELSSINLKLQNNDIVDESECDKVNFNGVPYYLFFVESKISGEIDGYREDCKLGLNGAIVIN